MNFKKTFIIWLLVTIVSGLLTFLVNKFFPSHTLWPFGIAFLYLGTLLLFLMYLVTIPKQR